MLRTKHGPSSAGKQRGCRSQCAGWCGAMLSLARGPYRCCHLLCTRSCPVSRTRTLTDAVNAMYHCLPNHALRWLKPKGVGGGPCFQADQGLLLKITRDKHDMNMNMNMNI